MIAEAWTIDSLREGSNWLAHPARVMTICAIGLVAGLWWYRVWTRPRWAALLLGGLLAVVTLAGLDPVLRDKVCRPDNLAILLLVLLLCFFVWRGLRQAAVNDDRAERGEPPFEAGADDKVLTWPHLVFLELVALVACSAFLVIWSLLVRAPLEPPADLETVLNPAKAPWYFVGLQELLVYFDPWLAGVVLPVVMVVGLSALPYLDRNPRGSGYYTLRERPLAVSVYLAAFILLWMLPILVGTFLRGPNWTLYGPFEPWDPHTESPAELVNLSAMVWGERSEMEAGFGAEAALWRPVVRELPGIVLLGFYFLVMPWVLSRTAWRGLRERMGSVRYLVFSVLLMGMGLVPAKMLLRWLLDVRYIVALTEWSLNI